MQEANKASGSGPSVCIKKPLSKRAFVSVLPVVAVPIYYGQLFGNTLFADYMGVREDISSGAKRAIRGAPAAHPVYVRLSLCDTKDARGYGYASLLLCREHWLHRISRSRAEDANLQMHVTSVDGVLHVWLQARRAIAAGEQLFLDWEIDEEIVRIFPWLASRGAVAAS